MRKRKIPIAFDSEDGLHRGKNGSNSSKWFQHFLSDCLCWLKRPRQGLTIWTLVHFIFLKNEMGLMSVKDVW